MGYARQLKLFIYARILVTFLFLVSTVVLILQEPETIDDLSYNGVVRLMVFSFLFSVISYLFSKVRRFQFFISYLQTIWDLLFVTVLLLFTGGVASPYSFLYLLSIMNAGVLLGRKEAFYTASLCGILYGAISDLQLFGFLEPIGLKQIVAQQVGAMHILYNIFMNLIGFFLTAIITGHLSELAKQNEDALAKKNVNYDELERLNSTIVSNMESGLVTVTREGNIRVFNPYAEELTGKKLTDVYDQPLNSIFPSIFAALGDMDCATGGEFLWSVTGGSPLTLGFSAVPFNDARDECAGAIISFKNLTEKKQMEVALKRSEKLAALGELSARMAHEIRNPLAAMSGSVQLLADQGSVTANDQRLLAIIVRETERLNNLITSFLIYARPVSPHKEIISFHGFIEEIRLLLAADPKFLEITISNHVPKNMDINADANQMRQVMANLLNNSAEAISGRGEITIGAYFEAVHCSKMIMEDQSVITVSDNGSGITDDVAAHLFEPFWTTKNNGTGLGLAITYRIIEEHGGSIRAESSSSGGCRIVLRLPK